MPNRVRETTLHRVAALIREKTDSRKPVRLIAVGGPGGCGKSTFARQLAGHLINATVLGLDDYKTSRAARKQAGIFGPHPEANRMDLIQRHLTALQQGQPIRKPVYDLASGEALMTVAFPPRSFVIVEGEVSTYPVFRSCMDFTIFIDAGLLTQLAARLGRDVQQRGHSREKASLNFLHSNLREFPAYGAPTRHTADVRLFCRHDYGLEFDPEG